MSDPDPSNFFCGVRRERPLTRAEVNAITAKLMTGLEHRHNGKGRCVCSDHLCQICGKCPSDPCAVCECQRPAPGSIV